MPTNIASRVTLIVVILLAAVWAIFPGLPKALLTPFTGQPVDLRPDLRPGIDISGGTSLIYEIRDPTGAYNPNLAEEIASVLKRRIDPDGVRNLIWRPSGNRLEIQMPLTRAAKEAQAIRTALSDRQLALEATNIRVGSVLNAIETLTGDARRDRLNQLAGDSRRRQEIFGALASAYDQMKLAQERNDFREGARLKAEYDALVAAAEKTNIDLVELQDTLELLPELREPRLAALRECYPDFPSRQQAIDAYVEAYERFRTVQGTFDSTDDLKRSLRGSGVLSFVIVADDIPQDEYNQWVARLQNEGPRPRPGDPMRWFLVDRPEEFRGSTQEYNGRHYILAHTTPERSLMKREGQAEWALQRAGRFMDGGEWKVSFEFDAQGARYFGELTGRHVPQGGRNYRLGIVLDDRMISAPNINSRIDGHGSIEGGRGGFSQDELNYLVNTLNAGSLPASTAAISCSSGVFWSSCKACTAGVEGWGRGLPPP